jgi:hypothetical protein
MVTTSCTPRSLCRLWRRQLMCRLDSDLWEARRRFVAMTFLNLANTVSTFVDIQNLLVVLLYEDSTSGGSRMGRSPVRFSGYRLSRVPHGIQWGGRENSAFLKNLLLAPKARAYGQRMDSKKSDLLSLALKLDRRLSLAARHSAAPWPALRLPTLWAGFQQRDLRILRFAGPEFEASWREASASASSLVETTSRQVDGLTLYPIDWVSSQLGMARAIFAEIRPTMSRPVFRVEEIFSNLIGFQGASRFDFFDSRYRRHPGPNSNRKFTKGHCKRPLWRLNAACVSPVRRDVTVAGV